MSAAFFMSSLRESVTDFLVDYYITFPVERAFYEWFL